MAIQKNFVVKNGLEVNNNLIFADKTRNKVGIGTTATIELLQVAGGIGATSLNISGISTFSTLKSTVANISTSYSVSGVVTSLSGGSLSYTGLSTIGNVKFEPAGIITAVSGIVTFYGDSISSTIDVTDATFDNLVSTSGTITTLTSTNGTVTNLSGTGITYTSGDFTTINVDNLYAVSGVVTTLTGTSGTITSLTSTDVSVTNITGTSGTITTLDSTSGTITVLSSTDGSITNITGTAGTITVLSSTDGSITNITGTAGTITTLDSTDGVITNITGTGLTYTSGDFTTINVDNLYAVSGVVTTLSGSTLSYSGLSTVGSLRVGSATTINDSGLITTGIVTASFYYGDGSQLSNLPGAPTIYWTANLDSDIYFINGNVGVGTSVSLGGAADPGNTKILNAGIVTANSYYGDNFYGNNFYGGLNGTLSNTLTLNTSGTGLSGSATFNNSGISTFTVTSNATDSNTVSTIVARDGSGNFSAGTITANLTGNASGSSGSCTGNAATATVLQNSRSINGVSFNGSANINVEPYVERDDSTNATRYISFVDDATAAYKRLNMDANLTYNPSSNTLTAGTFSGALSGTASNANTLDSIDSSQFLRSDAADQKTSGTLRFNDNIILSLGSGDDAEFFCNGSHLYLDLNSGIGNFYIRDGSTTRFTFDDNGSFTATSNITAYSDINLKKDIEVIPNALDKVLQLRGVTYNRIDLEGEENQRQSGVIAQEVEKVLPEVVQTNEDGIKSVAYGNMIGLLIEAIKEQQKQINNIKSKLEQ